MCRCVLRKLKTWKGFFIPTLYMYVLPRARRLPFHILEEPMQSRSISARSSAKGALDGQPDKRRQDTQAVWKSRRHKPALWLWRPTHRLRCRASCRDQWICENAVPGQWTRPRLGLFRGTWWKPVAWTRWPSSAAKRKYHWSPTYRWILGEKGSSQNTDSWLQMHLLCAIVVRVARPAQVEDA